MKRYWWVALLCSAAVQAASELSAVGELQWQKRVILVWPEAGKGSEPEAILRAADGEIEARHLIWFVLDDKTVATNYRGPLAADFADSARQGFAVQGVEVVLVGKDGGVKSRSAELDLPAMFALIDGMPMRQMEMQDTP